MSAVKIVVEQHQDREHIALVRDNADRT